MPKVRSDAAEVLQTGAVRTASGGISGYIVGAEHDVQVYKGIPYAAPPIGNLRWKPPHPVASWDGVRVCNKYSSSCVQPRSVIFAKGVTDMSEDCLYLNVWAPAKAADHPYPVMVWIHGGAFIIGSTCQPWYDGEALARRGVILVSINYRLGPFGFLAHPELSRESDANCSGNYGLLDQIAALEWVQKNIAAFGGNPRCVTIFGESAGGASVRCLVASPLAKGLFHRAIAESGGGAALRNMREDWYGKEPMEKVGLWMARELHCDRAPDSVAALRQKPAAELLAACKSAQKVFGRDCAGPCVDGWVLPDDPVTLFQDGKVNEVPFIAGSNANEVSPLFGRTFVRKQYGHDAANILGLFPGKQRAQAGTTVIFGAPARADVRAMSKHGTKAYLYRFSHTVPSLRFLGAFHSAEIPYVFGNMDKLKAQPADLRLSETMVSYWTNFARAGNPNAPGLPEWPEYNDTDDQYVNFCDSPRVESNPLRSACDGIDKIRMQLTIDCRNKRAELQTKTNDP